MSEISGSFPANKYHPLNRGHKLWLLSLPHLMSGPRAIDIMDTGPHGNHVPITGAASSTLWGATDRPGGWGQWNLDAGPQHLRAVDPPDLDPGLGQPFTFTAWVKSSDTVNDQVVFNKRAAAGYQVRYTSGGGFFLRIDEGATLNDTVATPIVMDGEWHFICAGRNLVENFISVDLNPRDVTADTTLADLTNANDFFIGANGAGGTVWNGAIDDASYWNRALTVLEGKQLYYLSQQRYPGMLNRNPNRAFLFFSAAAPDVSTDPFNVIKRCGYSGGRINRATGMVA